YLCQDGFHAPNDLAVARDGSVWFTDPGHYPPDPPVGRVLVLERDGSVRVAGADFWFCNGIAFDPAGTPVVIERVGLQRLNPDGTDSPALTQWRAKGGGDRRFLKGWRDFGGPTDKIAPTSSLRPISGELSRRHLGDEVVDLSQLLGQRRQLIEQFHLLAQVGE